MKNKTQTNLDPSFYILGPLVGDNLTFYSIDKGWVLEFDNASPFTGEILTLTLPTGATSVMPFSSENEPLDQLNTLPGGGGFEKVF